MPVGALVVDPVTSEVVAEAHNMPIGLHDPCAHAEVLAIRKAAQLRGNYRLTGLDLYVSLEPCTMCAAAISFARIRKLVFGASDIKGGGVANGVAFFSAPTCHWKPEFVHAVDFQDEASSILKQIFANRRRGI